MHYSKLFHFSDQALRWILLTLTDILNNTDEIFTQNTQYWDPYYYKNVTEILSVPLFEAAGC
jgi:hypothetical protein